MTQLLISALVPALLLLLLLTSHASADTRTIETRFALSADHRSEFSTQVPLLSAGRVVVEANWTVGPGKHPSLRLMLIRPDGCVVVTRKGKSTLSLEFNATDQDVDQSEQKHGTKWSVKILNDVDADRSEVSGTIRITVPVISHQLEDTQFTLLGSGNAQEIPFNAPSVGRLFVVVTWQPDLPVESRDNVLLLVSLIHPGEEKTYARRQGHSPINVDQQITEPASDRGGHWIVRIQNDSHTKVNGRVTVTFTPSL